MGEPLRRLARHIFVVGGVAADNGAERDDRVIFAEKRDLLRHYRLLPGAGGPIEVYILIAYPVARERVLGSLDQLRGDKLVET